MQDLSWAAICCNNHKLYHKRLRSQVVGDWNDLKSKVRESADSNRSYQALEEVGVKPNVWFKVKVRNEHNAELEKIQVAEAGHGHGHAATEDKKSH